MRARNHVIYGDDDTLRRLKADYDFIGRPCEVQDGRLVVFALPPKKQVKKAGRGPKRGR